MMAINLVDLVFINFICAITVLGALINFIEPYLPVFITQTFRYGKHAHKGAPNWLAQIGEIPKSYFKHFYVFALLWSGVVMYLVTHVYVGGYQAPDLVVTFLDIMCGGSRRQVRTGPAASFLAVLLLFVQCVRRFYETHFLQVFSSTSKIHVTHYLVGYWHYFGAFSAILSQAQGFVRQPIFTPSSLRSHDIGSIQWVAAGIFMYAWYHQFMSNLILANLRKNDMGNVVTQKHLMPSGGYFEMVSSPHMFFEVVMYAAIYLILYNNSSWLFVMCWVMTNQVENAWLTQKWYLATFPNYPKHRRAIFPKLL